MFELSGDVEYILLISPKNLPYFTSRYLRKQLVLFHDKMAPLYKTINIKIRLISLVDLYWIVWEIHLQYPIWSHFHVSDSPMICKTDILTNQREVFKVLVFNTSRLCMCITHWTLWPIQNVSDVLVNAPNLIFHIILYVCIGVRTLIIIVVIRVRSEPL